MTFISVAAHDGQPAKVTQCVLDESGRVYLKTDIGFGVVYTQDVAIAATAVESGLWQPVEMKLVDFPVVYRFKLSPSTNNK